MRQTVFAARCRRTFAILTFTDNGSVLRFGMGTDIHFNQNSKMIDAVLLFMGLGRAGMLFLVLVLMGSTIWALIDTIKSDFKKDVNKVVRIIVILSIPPLGGLLYYLIGTGQKVSG
jgi:hypothetical protein